MRATLAVLVGIAWAVLAAQPLGAQSLRDRFSELFTFGICGEPLCLDVNASVHGDHFIPSIVQGRDNTLEFMLNAIGFALGNIPLTAAASGVAYRFEGGVPIATTVSAGPIFADRAETLGRGRLLAGINVAGIGFNEVRGAPLSRLTFRFPHQNVQNGALGDPDWENDVIVVTTDLGLSLVVTTVYATYGVADGFDLGVAVPLVRAGLTGSSQAVFDHFDSSTSPHFFGSDEDQQVIANTATEGSAFGLGDVAGRAKLLLAGSERWAVSLLGDVRLATGAEEDFLGSGATNLRALVVGSTRIGAFAAHGNTGVLLSSAANQSNRFLATAAVDRLIGQQVTFAGGLAGNFQMGQNLQRLPEPVVYTAPEVRTMPLTTIPERADHFVDASLGFKILAAPNFRAVTSLLLPLSNAGVQPAVLWTAGLERTF